MATFDSLSNSASNVFAKAKALMAEEMGQFESLAKDVDDKLSILEAIKAAKSVPTSDAVLATQTSYQNSKVDEINAILVQKLDWPQWGTVVLLNFVSNKV